MTTQLERCIGTRDRIIADLRHLIATIFKYSELTHPGVLKYRSTELTQTWVDFNENIRNIEASILTKKDELPENFLQINHELGDAYCDTLVFIEDLLAKHTPKLSALESATEVHRPSFKLPQLNISQFSGKYEDWSHFKGLFRSAYSKFPLMPNVEKFYYLRSYLSTEPLRLVKHLPSDSEDSYNQAWNILQNRYENKRLIVNTHLRNFMSLPALQAQSADSLRNMLDTTNECLSALNSYDIDTSTWDPIVVHVISQKMDPDTLKHWEEHLRASRDVPTLTQLTEFLNMRFNVLDGLAHVKRPSTPSSKPRPPFSKTMLAQATNNHPNCPICDQQHRAYLCPSFAAMALSNRLAVLNEKGLCHNCLYPHKTEDCKSPYLCRICKKKHNSLLHNQQTLLTMDLFDEQAEENELLTESSNDEFEVPKEPESPDEIVLTAQVGQSSQTLLATALIPVRHKDGRKTMLKALIDQGSTVNLITERAAQLLGLPKIPVSIPLFGVGNVATANAKYKTEFIMGSLYDDAYEHALDAFILTKITYLHASHRGQTPNWPHITGLKLADPSHTTSGSIDILLGARTYAEIIMDGLVKGPEGTPIAQQTKLGWVLSGSSSISIAKPSCNLVTEDSLSQQLKRFWEIEEVNNVKNPTAEEEECERLYKEGLTRMPDGRFRVRLPFRNPPYGSNFLGESYQRALKCFLQLEKRLTKNPELYKQYRKSINEYFELGHMTPSMPIRIDSKNCYFLPHHAVFKVDSTTTKVRPVFNASSKTTNGLSLNDQLMVGPTIQDDLFDVMLRFRIYRFAFISDIEKMYRQVWVHPLDAPFQSILWRNSTDEPIQQFMLLTVSFGTASAAFQAVRTLFEIAKLNEKSWPIIAHAIRKMFYVDDFLGGSHTIEDAKYLYQHSTTILSEYGMNLRKWVSNSHELLQMIPETEREIKEPLISDKDSLCKTLGIKWQPRNDTFHVKINFNQPPVVRYTKRRILSEIAQIFDPMGWIAPAVIQAKLIIQNLWLEGLGWDDSVSETANENWTLMRSQLEDCERIQIDRWFNTGLNNQTTTLIGFADASEKAYAAVTYFRVQHEDGSITVKIIASKSRVAPLKTISLPRLELCAAVLLSKLMQKIMNAVEIEGLKVKAFTDSEIVLAWIASPPNRWKTFIANRVTEIQETLPADSWQHIRSAQNPADCASRGMSLDKLKTFPLWWNGPEFLYKPEDTWPKKQVDKYKNLKLEERAVKILHLNDHLNTPDHESFITRFSSLERLLNVTAYCMRWRILQSGKTWTKSLDADELFDAKLKWTKITQSIAFPDELNRLRGKKPLSSKNSLLSLNPFVDKDGLIRVGGRLHNSELTESQKHPIILPAKSPFTYLVIDQAHTNTLHGGLQLTLQYARQQFWILRARSIIKTQINKCVTCFRYRHKTSRQQMGILPEPRVCQSRPFSHVGIDFAGYFEVKTSNRRNAPYEKCYIAIFVCLSTKAIHLELVSGLSTAVFLMSFKRFSARRGIPNHVYSDCGTNFVGASRELPKLLSEVEAQQTQEILHNLAKLQIKWHFIPAHSPHFGGIWEAGVKSTKYHLKRVLGDTKLQFEAFSTLIAQIESCLNSRPLCGLSSDPEDLDALTPGHFLIGQSTNALPEPDVGQLPTNRLNHYQMITKLLGDFWKKWHLDYLNQLQQRPKWHNQQPNLQINDLVLIKEDNIPPSRWLLGRIVETFPGRDGLVRVAEIKTQHSTLRRPIHKLCRLPVEQPIVNLLLSIRSRGGVC